LMRATLGCMNAQKLVEAAKEYRTILETHGIVAERVSDRDLERILDSCNGEDRQVLLRHVLWICCHIPVMINRPAGQSFCFRWIGCVEGILVAYGILSVEHVREQFRKFVSLRALEDELDALPRRL
jgi:hypothetical protein